MRRPAALLITIALLAGAAHAQAPTVANAMTTPHGCTYDTCALRLSHRVFGGVRVQRGLDGPWQKFGFAGGGVGRAVQSVPAAVAAADTAHRLYQQGAVSSLLGAVLSTIFASAAVQNDISSSTRSGLAGASLAAVGLTVFGGIQITRGRERYSRAIWLFNREIPR